MQYFNTTRLCLLFDITIPDDPHIYYDDALMPKGKIKSPNAGIPCSAEQGIYLVLKKPRSFYQKQTKVKAWAVNYLKKHA